MPAAPEKPYAGAQVRTKDSLLYGPARLCSSVPALPGRRRGESSERLCALRALPAITRALLLNRRLLILDEPPQAPPLDCAGGVPGRGSRRAKRAA
jgi:ABC-type branched-subunit amino acid transport system ATPase component